MLLDFYDCMHEDPRDLVWFWDVADMLDWYYDEGESQSPNGPPPGPSGSVIGVTRETNARHVYLTIYSLSYRSWKSLSDPADPDGYDRWVNTVTLTSIETALVVRTAIRIGVIDPLSAVDALGLISDS